MKKLCAILFLAVAFITASRYSSAQSLTGDVHQTLINRVDFLNSSNRSVEVVGKNAAQGGAAVTYLVEQAMVSASENSTAYVKIYVANHTDSAISVYVVRKHIHVPFGWSSPICSPELCYLASKDSLPDYTLAAGQTGLYELNINVPKGAFPDSLVDELRFVAKTENPNDGFTGRFGAVVAPLGVEQERTANSLQAKILAIYPSPLMDGNSIRVKLVSPREQNFTYAIIDELGKECAFGTSHQRLSQGDNTCQIGELNGLSKGNYILKFTFADGTSDTRMFQIAR